VTPYREAARSRDAILSMRGIRKRFGAAVALDGVELEVRRGEVHALVGENGAGKSTLMKVLSGAARPDAGRMQLDGALYAPRDPADALRRGVAMIYQELTLAPDLGVEQNLLLGREPHRLGVVRSEDQRERCLEVLAILAHPDLAPDRVVRTLGPGPRQLVEIGRALLGSARIVVLDEPTSSLSAAEAHALDAVIEKLRGREVSIVYITHFLEEVERIADRYTVLRDGRTVATGEVRGTPRSALVEAMIGRPIDEVYPRTERTPGEVVLEISALAGAKLPKSASLALRRGEVFGIAGLVGAGRTELLRAIYGLDPVRSGTVRIGSVADRGRPVHARIAQRVGLLSEDRKGEGIALERPIEDNVALPREVSRFGVIGRARREAVARWIRELGIKARGPEQAAGELSGGNQQKVAIARLLHQDADVVLLDEPTRGVDVGSKVEIYRRIGDLAAAGKAVLVVSSYLPELLGICDRIAVMHRGVLGEPRPASSWTEASLLDAAIGGAA
jgi:ribose transport system ATP-binding protein